jgi:dihydroorotase
MSEAPQLTLKEPDDFHHHFRDGEALASIVPLVATRFRRAVRDPHPP